MWDFLSKIPKEGKIMLQNNIAVFFTHQDLDILKDCQDLKEIDPDVVALDFRPGQNPNNLWPSDEKKMRSLATLLQGDPSYRVLYSDDYRYIFKKERSQESHLICPRLDEEVVS